MQKHGRKYFPVNFAKFLKTLSTTSGGCFFLSQDTKYQNALLELHAKGLSFDSKYSQSGNRFPLIIEAYLELSQKSTVVDRCSSSKQVFLKILSNSQENIYATLLIKILPQKCFPVNFAKFLRTPFLQNTSTGCF